MKTIAIDEGTSKLLDALAKMSSRRRSRAALVRAALRQSAGTVRRQAIEAKDGALFRKHRKRLASQARALVAEQARL
jgi:predicted transcriptional regulator